MPELLSTKLPRQLPPLPASTLSMVLIGVIAIAALHFGREVLVPIALAVLLSFVLAPLVSLLRSWYIPRVIAVLFVALLAFSTIFGLGAVMVAQVTQLAGDLPGYQSTLRDKIQSLRGVAGGTGTLERASQILQDLGREIDRPSLAPGSPSAADEAPASKPIAVEVKQPDPGSLQLLVGLITPLIHPLTTTGIVVIFVIFILLQRQDLRNRLVRLAGARDLQRTTAALDDAGQRLSRLFLTQLALNAGFGLVIGIALWLIGVPSAPLWGMLAMIMRFVPYIGGVISAIFPLVLAAAVGPGWMMVVMTAALFLTAETLAGHVIEPLVFGQSTGLSPVAVIASATFWTWLWGPIGLILATPLTMCLVVLGRHVDRLNFLEVMFGDEPPLTPAELIYQRMLARDPVEVAEQARTFLKEAPLAAYYDEILLEGLKLAQADAERDLLDDEKMHRIRDAIAEIVDDLATHVDKEDAPDEDEADDARTQSPLAQLEKAEARDADRPLSERWQSGTPVLFMPGPSLLDEAAAAMAVHLLGRKGIGARAEQADVLSVTRNVSWETQDVSLICLCYLEKATPAQIRYAIRRIRRRAPDVPILVALLGGAEGSEATEVPGALFARTLRDVTETIEAIASNGADAPAAPSVSAAA